MFLPGAKNIRWPINVDHGQVGYYVGDRNAPEGAAKSMRFNDLNFGSRHPDGALFAMADGSVRFHADGIDFVLFEGMATRNGEEVAP